MNNAILILLVKRISSVVVFGFILTVFPVIAEYGDIIMNQKSEMMREAEVDDVVFPHWFHRIRYRCNVCHEELFKLKVGSNDINMEKITDENKLCGKCHNGLIAWDVIECERCHSLEPGWTGGPIQKSREKSKSKKIALDKKKFEKLHPKPYTKFMQIASGWHPVALSKSGLPLDKYGLVDWSGAVKNKIVDPLWSLDEKDSAKEIQSRDTRILFESGSSTTVANVIFPHDIHSYWLQCDICHKTSGGAIFNKEAGSTPVNMLGMSRGKWCGRCHNSVSFPMSDCDRCHAIGKNDPIEPGIILRSEITGPDIQDDEYD